MENPHTPSSSLERAMTDDLSTEALERIIAERRHAEHDAIADAARSEALAGNETPPPVPNTPSELRAAGTTSVTEPPAADETGSTSTSTPQTAAATTAIGTVHLLDGTPLRGYVVTGEGDDRKTTFGTVSTGEGGVLKFAADGAPTG